MYFNQAPLKRFSFIFFVNFSFFQRVLMIKFFSDPFFYFFYFSKNQLGFNLFESKITDLALGFLMLKLFCLISYCWITFYILFFLILLLLLSCRVLLQEQGCNNCVTYITYNISQYDIYKVNNGLINKMKSQTKTGSLILQKQKEALQQRRFRRQNPQNSANMYSQLHRNPLKKILAFDLKIQPTISNKKGHICVEEHYSSSQKELERQNFRLIEANLNMMIKHSSLMENIKKYILHAISRVEDQKYVDAIKTLYELLEKIRNQKQFQKEQFSPLGEIPENLTPKEKMKKQKSEEKQKIVAPFLGISSNQVNLKFEVNIKEPKEDMILNKYKSEQQLEKEIKKNGSNAYQMQYLNELKHYGSSNYLKNKNLQESMKKHCQTELYQQNYLENDSFEIPLSDKNKKVIRVEKEKERRKRKMPQTQQEPFYRFLYCQAETIESFLFSSD